MRIQLTHFKEMKMSLTLEANREREWGWLPELRKVLEDKEIKDPKHEYYGLTTAHDNFFEYLSRNMKIIILAEENLEYIKKCTNRQNHIDMIKDIEKLMNFSIECCSFFENKLDAIRHIMKEINISI
jgi:hypothetical protein